MTINDKHKKRMIVDSGATTISLPDKMARDMGIKADAERRAGHGHSGRWAESASHDDQA